MDSRSLRQEEEAERVEEVNHLLVRHQMGRLSRRGFLRLALLVGGVGAAQALLGTRAPALASVLTPAGGVTRAMGAVTPATAQASGQLIHAYTQEAVQFNPLLYVNTGVETAVQFHVFSTLWQMADTGEWIPDLAKEFPTVANSGISADGLTWTIHLRDNVKWHDGQPFTSKDVKFTYETLLNPNVAVRSRAGLERITALDTPDDYTVVMKLKEPYAPFPWVWQIFGIVPEHILSKVPDINTAEFNSKPVGTGPFTFVERVAGDHITYKAYPDYHLTGPFIETIIQKYNTDQTVLFTAFKTGEVDILDLQGIPPERYEEAKTLPGKKIVLSPSPFVEFIYFNLGKPQFKDKAVRQAIYIAIDKDAWINQVYYGVPPHTLSYLQPSHWAYNPNLKDPGYDPEKAKQMLDDAGWKVGADGIREKDGVKLAFTMSTTAGAKAREQAEILVQQNLKAVGIDMQINNMPASVVWGEYTVKSQFDTLMVGWEPSFGMDPDYSSRTHSKEIPVETGHGSNYVQYKNPEADKLLEDGLRETDPAKRKEIYWKLQEILLDDLPFAPIFGYNMIMGYKDTLLNYKPNPYCVDNSGNCYEWQWKA